MKTKQFLKKWIIPSGYFNLIRKIKNGYSQKTKHSNIILDANSILQYKNTSDKLIVLGNGPSLKQSLEKYLNILKDTNCICVNQFVESEWFEKIKPQFYALADPAYFEKNLSPYLQEKFLKLKKAFERTTWAMNFIVPEYALASEFVQEIGKNTNIVFLTYNSTNKVTPYTEIEKFKAYNSNKNVPVVQTVLNLCLYIGILLKYKSIYLIGADTSWHEDLILDQETNILYSNDKHFYGEKKIQIFLDALHTIPDNIHTEFYSMARAFESYWDLNKYANYNVIKIYNASEFSWIDAFERKTLNSLNL